MINIDINHAKKRINKPFFNIGDYIQVIATDHFLYGLKGKIVAKNISGCKKVIQKQMWNATYAVDFSQRIKGNQAGDPRYTHDMCGSIKTSTGYFMLETEITNA